MKNQVSLIGYVGLDPEIRKMSNGQKMARLNLATKEVYYNREGERTEHTAWHKVVAWGRHAEIIDRYVRKGRLLGVDGKLAYREYTTPEGEKRRIAEIRVENLQLLDRKEA
ncbi:MAG: single-stranded DNA-binding protein [Chlorobi bacterium]|nr:single-stranded DNA-binding protein [Chlorobiota bacterium]